MTTHWPSDRRHAGQLTASAYPKGKLLPWGRFVVAMLLCDILASLSQTGWDELESRGSWVERQSLNMAHRAVEGQYALLFSADGAGRRGTG